MSVPNPSTDLIDLRATRFAGALRVALGVSLGLHVVLAVTVRLVWHGHGAEAVKMEMPMSVEFSAEAAPEEGGAPTAPLVQSSATVAPLEPERRSPPDPVPESPTKAAVLDTAGEEVPSVPALLARVPLVEMKSAQAVTERGAMTAPALVASAPQRTAANRDANSLPKVPVAAEVANGKPGILARPLYRKNPEPAYPVAARRRRQEGVTLLSVHVTAAGRAGAVTVKQSSGFRLLDDAAAQAVLDWEFEPARIDAEPMESDIEVPVRFRLRD